MAIVIYALVALLALAAPTAGQTTRVEVIAKDQADKSTRVEAEGPSQAERVIRRVLLSPLLNGGEGVYPWFGSIYGGTGMGLGVGYLKRFQNASAFNLQSGITPNNSKALRGAFAAPALWRGKMQFDTSAQWLDVRGLSFYGFGQQSRREGRERLDFSPKDINASVTLRPVRFVAVTGGYTFMNFDTQRQVPRFAGGDAPGLDDELNYHVTRGTVALDWRPAPSYATRGGYYRATFERNIEAQGLPFSFVSQEYEVVQLLPLVREQFVLAARGLMTLTTADSGDAVPVMLAPFLGSGSTLRGYANRRFTDRNRVLLTGEYRWRPSRYLDMAVFMDAGQVATDRRDFDTSRFDVAWGVGARFHGPNFNALRLDVARGREGFRIVVAGGQPF